MRRRLSLRPRALGMACTCAILLISCGGQQGPPPPAGDFSLSVSPGSASIVVGNSTPAILVSINPQNGFAGTVNISLQGVPPGVSAMPAANFSVDAGTSHSVT